MHELYRDDYRLQDASNDARRAWSRLSKADFPTNAYVKITHKNGSVLELAQAIHEMKDYVHYVFAKHHGYFLFRDDDVIVQSYTREDIEISEQFYQI